MSLEKEKVKLVLARLETMPAHIKVNIGGIGSFDKEDLIEHVKKQDKLGKQIVNVQIAYLQQLKKGF